MFCFFLQLGHMQGMLVNVGNELCDERIFPSPGKCFCAIEAYVCVLLGFFKPSTRYLSLNLDLFILPIYTGSPPPPNPRGKMGPKHIRHPIRVGNFAK